MKIKTRESLRDIRVFDKTKELSERTRNGIGELSKNAESSQGNSANDYARGIGFDSTYIPSEHTGLYEKYGYSYIKDIINYSGDTDHLYAKKLR